MGAAAEGEVFLGVGPADVEAVGARAPVGLVAVRRGQAAHHEHALLDGLAAHLDLPQRDAARHLHGRVVAEELLDGAAVQRRVGAQALELVGVAEEGEGAVADEVHGRLVAGDVEEHHLLEELLVREHVAVLLGGEQAREKIVGQVVPLPLDDVEHELAHLGGGVEDGAHEVGVGDGLQGADERARPLPELLAVGRGHAQHLGDDGERQGEGVVGHELHVPGVGRPVERLVHQLLDTRAQVLDAAGGEGLGDELAQAGVVGRVPVEHRPGAALALTVAAEHLVGELVEQGWPGVGVLDAERRVAQEAQDVVVLEEQPDPERTLVDGLVLPHRLVLRVGILGEPGFEGVVRHRRRVGHEATSVVTCNPIGAPDPCDNGLRRRPRAAGR